MKIITKVLFIILVLTTIGYSQWTPTSLNKSGKCFCSVNNNIFTGGDQGIIYKTTDYGTTWTGVDIKTPINCLSKNTSSDNLYAGTVKGLWKSTNYGSTWDSVGFGNKQVYTVMTNSNLVMFGIDSGIYKSLDTGHTWTRESLMLDHKRVNSICDIGNGHLFAGTIAGIYETTNSGATWSFQTSTQYHNINVVAYLNTMIIVGSDKGFFWRTSSGGWLITPYLSYPVYSITSIGAGYIIMGKANGKVTRYYCQNLTSLTDSVDKSQGLPNGPITAIIKSGTYVLAGFSNMGPSNNVWRTSYNYVDVKKIASEVPSKYELGQNFPNPFNPSTTIRYQIPKQEVITLKIYDITGKEIETLVNELQSPGTYEVNWNASKYSSGTYFYRIEAGDYSETKSMLLVK